MEIRKRKAVAYWLLTGCIMIIIQILLGGITRLTGSGLSITEWKPIMGALPPMNAEEWNAAFAKYQEIAQFKYLNSHFSLEDFKFIFFWEWFHRLWARLLGVVFAIGFVYFLVRKYFDKRMVIPLIILFLLGGAQGLIGWIMVASGLNDSDLYVNHIKLAMHFMAALVLLIYTFWFALQLLVPQGQHIQQQQLYRSTIGFILLLTVQLIYGAFMAGLKAAPYAPTWPDMNGVFMPDSIGSASWINNPFNVQFWHRMLAYILVVVAIIWTVKAFKVTRRAALFHRVRALPIVLIVIQLVLGIYTVLHAPRMGSSAFGSYELLAQLHQLVAMFLLMALFLNLYLLRPAAPRYSESR